ncbi:diacylglycerol/lipid kinase family protein [Streptomonospora wellingtoniae]|uniref:Diacylglycerol kinase family protein n=1 Tax=Streptomonospora wellingtoniae TaxID=3075544 RepID=A0ABU2KVX1_9ACTN|nr:diacylglycerol kinase family protein [Streptomonospora sp. DSM 45055]MDT0303451.1 diacylglycerol kinase family protein [Streptomonospora sp. DSM 45055]
MLILSNTEAGSVDADRLREAAAELGTEAEVVFCSGSGDLDKALDTADGHDTLVAAGGDGSLHALANVLHRRGELGERTVGLLPMGTGNDFARTLGMPLEPFAAAAALRAASERPLDLIVDDAGEITVNAVHLGVGAESTRAASKWKRLLGPASFPVGGVIAGLGARGYRLRVVADGEVLIDTDHKALMVGLANGRYIGGGTGRLAPDAQLDDGLLHLTVSRSRGFTKRAVHAVRLHRGTHPLEVDVHHRRVHQVTVTGERCAASADGELKENVTGRTWRVLPAAWRFLVPPAVERPA